MRGRKIYGGSWGGRAEIAMFVKGTGYVKELVRYHVSECLNARALVVIEVEWVPGGPSAGRSCRGRWRARCNTCSRTRTLGDAGH
jgi:hypothetical protein